MGKRGDGLREVGPYLAVTAGTGKVGGGPLSMFFVFSGPGVGPLFLPHERRRRSCML